MRHKAPNETRTDLWWFASLACKPLVIHLAFSSDVAQEQMNEQPIWLEHNREGLLV